MNPLSELKIQVTATLSDVGLADSPVAIVDFPYHQNAGDSMIFMGELAALAACRADVRYIADDARFAADELREACPEGPLLIHGGGNFGDIWPRMQAFRLQMFSMFTDREIIQLPQSIYFHSAVEVERARVAMGRHGGVTLLLREVESLERAKREFGSVARIVPCPDAAFGLQLADRRVAGGKLIVICRNDHESSGVLAAADLPDDAQWCDWGLKGLDALAFRALRLPAAVRRRARLGRSRFLDTAVQAAYPRLARRNVDNAIKLLCGARLLVTDRMHGMVLAALIGLPVIAVDNSYGKVGAIYREYFASFENVRLARSAEELRELVYRG